MDKTNRFPRVALAGAASLTLLLAGACSSDDDTASSTTTTAESASSKLEAPVIVDGADDVTVKVGGFVVVSDSAADRVETSDPDVLEVSQAYDDGSAEFNAGAEALGEGSATMSVYSGDELLYEVDVTVEG